MVLFLAFAEWAVERLVAEYSRTATTTIEVAIVLVAALVFRPIHQRIEATLENAFYWRKHHALSALMHLREELTSFSDMMQLLRRVLEAVEHYMEASACAVYLRRADFHAEATSFDGQSAGVPLDDPIAMRFRSSASAIRPEAVKSAAPGTHAFPMIASGEVLGFIALESKHGEYDHEEMQALAGLAQDLAVAVLALEPRLRPKHGIPNNLPSNVQPLIGRERDLDEIDAAIARGRLTTITGPGGVGKTRVALESAQRRLEDREDGTWFVDLSPIADAQFVAPSILGALGVQPGEDALATLVEYLQPRRIMLLLDNCEHVIGGVSDVVSQLLRQCPDVAILATSRELFHLEGEQVHRLGPLDRGTAAALFTARATAISSDFRWDEHAEAIAGICEHLDGMPLAIELAAARTRSLSIDDIYDHLSERFRLLTNAARDGTSRHQTLSATIEWSYDLLSSGEAALFVRLGTFRGSFSLPAAAAVCAQGGQCDEFYVLDVLTSLADKSLLTVTIGTATRYRLLETIREFTLAKSVEMQASAIVARQHAAYFAGLAAQAYHEFDTRLPEGWLDALVPDLDNFRAALNYLLCGPGDRPTGAQLAADCGPLYLRLGYLSEGLAWVTIARNSTPSSLAIGGRLEYVASMMHNNLGEKHRALHAAERAVESYAGSSDERGHVRALSQVAQLYSRAGRFDDAKQPAREAIERAQQLDEPRVHAGVLRRCAASLAPEDIDEARPLFEKAIAVARAAHEPEEVYLSLYWWATAESASGSFTRAIDLAREALTYATPSVALHLEIGIAQWALILDDAPTAMLHAANGLRLSLTMQHPLARATAIAYNCLRLADSNASDAAKVFGYASGALEALDWEPESDDRQAMDRVAAAIRARLSEDAFASLVASGRMLTEADAVRTLQVVEVNTRPERSVSVVR